MKLKKIDHIGALVRDLREASRFFTDTLGLEVEKTVYLEELKVKIGFIRLRETAIELVEPTDGEGRLAKDMEKRGQGLHHICIEVDDIDEILETLKKRGVHLLDEKAMPGAEGKVAFINPRSTSGILLELVEKKG